MSNQLPDVGDIAEVVAGGPCGHRPRVGRMLVTEINTGPVKLCCAKCGCPWTKAGEEICEDFTTPEHVGLICAYPRKWLRKIPPVAEPIVEREKVEA